MNRYTYKAKRKDNGEWVYGYYVKLSNIDYIFTGKQDVYECGIELGDLEYIDEQYEIIPETLCQCTGLQDIEGNYIFENDIVKNHCHFKAIVKFGEYKYWDINNYGFYIQDIEHNDIFNLWAEGCKIIGNKFDDKVE